MKTLEEKKETKRICNAKWQKDNPEKANAYTAKWRKANPDKINAKASRVKSAAKEGIGVYVATFPSGLYIGEGLIAARRQKHMNGNSDIARKLKESATSFTVWFKGTKEWCQEHEKHVIDHHVKKNIEILNKII